MELIVEDLSVARGGMAVLEGVCFRLAGGHALVLRGPNGAGKTTLLRTLAGLQPPRGGRISLDREAMVYAAHADGIKAVLTVEENLRFWAELYRVDAVGAALEAFALGPLADRPAGALSAGQMRRLGLARLLVTGRRVWVLDEPTVSLDAAAVGMFARAVRAHLAGGGLAVIATHIELGLEAEVLDVARFRPRRVVTGDEDFL
ncbi:heme ABC exporter ATP-binding protein CcmA [Pseudooceanicola nanhaiensis]|uniref:heme ABC exporter ATP-binding protein CcmA n=1 Tax=Pseudooceanicola nanhaiensis TaxID=375761 RepID=UPI0040582287